MKIGFDAQAVIGKSTGLGVYTRNILKALTENPGGHDFRIYSRPVENDLNTAQRLRWENIELPARARRDHLDILHVPAFAPPMLKPCRLVTTVHDLIGAIYPNQMGLPSRLYWGCWLPRAVRGSDAAIADSEATRKDLMKHVRFPEKKIRVIYPSGHEGFSVMHGGPALAEIKKRLKIIEKYFLFVGTIEPRKNLARVIEAFMQYQKTARSARYQLVVTGSRQFAHGRALQALLKLPDLNLEDILFTGYLSHEDLNLLYSGAEAFLFPSLHEGFGIPVLEAMAAGTPVITSDRSSLPEVAGDAALQVNPYETGEITEAMRQIAADTKLRADLIDRGFRRIRQFSWQKTASQILEVYETLV